MELLLLLLYNRAYLFSVFAYLGFKNSFAYSHNGFNLHRGEIETRELEEQGQEGDHCCTHNKSTPISLTLSDF